ncbi:MAG: hypothetical protein Kow0010_17890 [Dehalococcoidia bacterium]
MPAPRDCRGGCITLVAKSRGCAIATIVPALLHLRQRPAPHSLRQHERHRQSHRYGDRGCCQQWEDVSLVPSGSIVLREVEHLAAEHRHHHDPENQYARSSERQGNLPAPRPTLLHAEDGEHNARDHQRKGEIPPKMPEPARAGRRFLVR